MKIKNLTYLFRIKKFSLTVLFFLIFIIIKSVIENSLYYGIAENIKDYFWIGLILAISSFFDISKVKIKIKNINNNEDKEEALKWVKEYFEINKAHLIVDSSAKKIFLKETVKGLIIKKRRQDFYFVVIKTDRVTIEGPCCYNLID